MICQACNQNLATVHLTEIVQKTKKETHLCEDCARKKGVTYEAQFSVKDFLGGLSNPTAAGAGAEAPSASPTTPPAPAVTTPAPEPCEACHITWAEFRQSGRFGCHQDYETFRTELSPLLVKIHGAAQHTGRVPARIGERLERERLRTRYQQELSEAIAMEHYERAAELRDRLRSLDDAESA